MNGLIAAEHLARYRLAADLGSDREVLDAGCGVGYGAEIIARGGASRVVGVDLAPEAIATASATTEAAVEFQVADVRDLPFGPGSFDLVVCFEVLEHLEDPERAVAELKGVLREDGVLVVSSPNRGVYPPGNPYHLHEFTAEELRDALTAKFANVVLMRQHPRLASLIADDRTLASTADEPVRAIVAEASQTTVEGIYTVALASDAPLAEPAATGVLTETVELHGLQESVEAAHEGRQRLRGALDAEHESREKLRAALDATRESHAKLRSEVEALEDDQRRLREALATANDDRASLRRALQAAAAETAQRERELHETERWLRSLERSRSWRITRPIRAAGALLRRLSESRAASRGRRV